MQLSNQYKPLLMLLIAFLGQNMAVGFSFGSIGLLIEPLSRDLNAKVATISLSVALIPLITGLTSPLVGILLDRWSLRGTVGIGCLLSALGYFMAARSQSIEFYIGSYSIVSLGFSMMGVIPANKIASIWFPKHRGLACGVVNVAALTALGPLFFQHTIAVQSWRDLLEYFALANIGLLLLSLLLDRPNEQQKETVEASAVQSSNEPSPFKKKLFWQLFLAKSLLVTSGIIGSTYLAPFARTVGHDAAAAAKLMTIQGSLSLVGPLVFGWLCDRMSPFAVLALNAGLAGLMWFTLVHVSDFYTLIPITAAIGLCSAGSYPMLAAIVGRGFPATQFASTLGLLSLVTLPITFAAAPVVGMLYDLHGNYTLAFQLEATSCLGALCVCFWLIANSAKLSRA